MEKIQPSEESRRHVDERRLAFLTVYPEFIALFGPPSDQYLLCVENPLPDDAEVVAAQWDPARGLYDFTVASASFEPVPPTDKVPELAAPVFEIFVETERIPRRSDPTVAALYRFIDHMGPMMRSAAGEEASSDV